MNVRFHQQEIRYLILKLLKQFYCLINSIIVTGSLLFNLDMVLLLKIYDQRRQLDILREILRLKESSDYKEEACKSNSKFVALKQLNHGMMNQEMSREIVVVLVYLLLALTLSK